MLNLLIADDEKVIRESLARCLDWNAFGINVVGCHADGLEALDCIIDESPDIVMTDIKMPGISGLDLIGKMRAIDQDIEFIILSGYREFDFAKRAMELGVRRYLLKPVGVEQVKDAILDAMKCLEERRATRRFLAGRSPQPLPNQMEAAMPHTHESQQDDSIAKDRDGLEADQALPALRREQAANGNGLVEKVLQYVQLNLADSTLSLKRIAAQYAHANPDYLSRLFVQETGEKFSHYLNRKRVAKAKELLLDEDCKVYLVAEHVGLGHNPRYFCQVFKKYTGMTPSRFIESLRTCQ